MPAPEQLRTPRRDQLKAGGCASHVHALHAHAPWTRAARVDLRGSQGVDVARLCDGRKPWARLRVAQQAHQGGH